MLLDPLPWWRVLVPPLALLALAVVCRLRPVPLLQIILRVCLALIGYGMLQDQVSARLCPEYFTIGHPPISGISAPTLLGIAWGLLGGLPGGILLGTALALAMRSGPRPPLAFAAVRRPILLLLAGMALGTLISGLSAWYNASVVNIAVGIPWSAVLAPERQRAFFIVASAHFATYLSAAGLGLGLCGWAFSRRGRPGLAQDAARLGQ
jgi:hypothetical protein